MGSAIDSARNPVQSVTDRSDKKLPDAVMNELKKLSRKIDKDDISTV